MSFKPEFYYDPDHEYDPRYVSAAYPPNWFLPEIVFKRSSTLQQTGDRKYLTQRFLTGETVNLHVGYETEEVTGWIPMRLSEEHGNEERLMIPDGTWQQCQGHIPIFDIEMIDGHYFATMRPKPE